MNLNIDQIIEFLNDPVHSEGENEEECDLVKKEEKSDLNKKEEEVSGLEEKEEECDLEKEEEIGLVL